MNDVFEACKLSNPNDGFEALECVSKTLNTDMHKLNDRIDGMAQGLNVFFLIFASVIMFIMQAGFGMLCAGSVRKKNVQNTMLKNLLDACGCGIAFFVCGYAFAYGSHDVPITRDEQNIFRSSTFISTESFFLMGVDNYAFWFYQFAFAATSTTIVAGTLAERSQMVAYFLYSILLSGFVFPVIAHSVWSIEGFLNADKANRLFGSGMIDFAGSGVVHVTGGLTALIASKILGPRKDRFHDDLGNPLHTPNHIQKYSVSLQVLGTFLLWFGWYGFNVGSVKFIATEEYANVAALSAITTTLGATSGAVTALGTFAFWSQQRTGEIKYDISYALNGCLSGLVAITGGCALIEPWAALMVGSTAGIIYVLASNFLIYLRIDDAVDAIPVHLFNGIWGVVAVGLFASPSRMENVYQRSDHVGLFYSWGRGSSDATLLGTNMIGLLFIFGFVAFVMLPFFFVLLYLGWFRSDPMEEIVGLDLHYRGNVDSERYMGKTSGQHLHAATANQNLKTRYHFESDHEIMGEGDIEQQVEETVDTSAT